MPVSHHPHNLASLGCRCCPASAFVEIRHEILSRGLVASTGDTRLCRRLSQEAIRPSYNRSLLFARNQHSTEEPVGSSIFTRVLWQGRPPDPRDIVIRAGAKTGTPARRRKLATSPPGPGGTSRP